MYEYWRSPALSPSAARAQRPRLRTPAGPGIDSDPGPAGNGGGRHRSLASPHGPGAALWRNIPIFCTQMRGGESRRRAAVGPTAFVPWIPLRGAEPVALDPHQQSQRRTTTLGRVVPSAIGRRSMGVLIKKEDSLFSFRTSTTKSPSSSFRAVRLGLTSLVSSLAF